MTDPRSPDTDGDGLTDGKEAGAIVAAPGSPLVYSGFTDPTRADSDGDGLEDKPETEGWTSTTGTAYQTDPTMPDTDGDGLLDGDEAGPATSSARSVGFALFSGPLLADTDGDGLTDLDEADLSLSPLDADTDADGIEDDVELQVTGTSPDAPDTDGDGFDDGYEVENAESQGLDPRWPDERVDPWAYAREFAQGALLGELSPGDSLPWLAGNLASGGTSLIPVVGWVTGTAADLRDAIAAAIRADWVGAGFSVAGLAPAVGDAAAVPVKVARFVARHPELASAVGAAVVALKWVPTEVKAAAVRSTSPLGWDYLRSAGTTEGSLLRLQEGRVGLESLAAGMQRSAHVAGVSAPFLRSGPEGEAVLERLFPAGATQAVFRTGECVAVCNTVARRVDVLVDGVAHESKVGRVTLTSSIKRQIESDAYLVATGAIESAHWHFFPSSVSNTIGARGPLLDLLSRHGIGYTFHLPS